MGLDWIEQNVENYEPTETLEQEQDIGNESDHVGIDCQIDIDPVDCIKVTYIQWLKDQRKYWPCIVQQNRCEQLRLYDVRRSFGIYNVFGARKYVKSSLKYETWQRKNTGHCDDNWLVDLILFSFPLQYTGPSDPNKGQKVANHSSDRQFHTLVGPFEKRPFSWSNVAPIMTRPNTEEHKRRIIVDYSFPQGGINAFLSKNEVFGTELPHVLPTVDQCIS